MAGYTSGGWRFILPFEGMSVFVKSNGIPATYRSGAWEFGVLRGSSLVIGDDQVVGARSAAIPSPMGGGTIDSEARSTVDQVLAALRQHGLIAS